MSKNLSRQLRFIKDPVTSRGGVIAAQNQQAADVGASVLTAGGNAVDAGITAAFALAVPNALFDRSQRQSLSHR